MMNLAEFSLNRKLIVFISLSLLISICAWLSTKIAIDAFPDTTAIQVQINTVAPSLNAEEIEQQITQHIELAIGGLPGLKSVRSVSKFGLSQVVVIYNDGTSVTDARQYISERLASVKLPEGIEAPELGPISTGLGEVFHYTLQSKSNILNLEQIRTIHDWVVKPALRKIPGVAEVNSWGGFEKQFHVIIKPEYLVKYQVKIDDVFLALKENNQNIGGGLITRSGQSILVHGLGRLNSIDSIENVVIKSHEGVPIKIKDVSEKIKIDYEIRRGAVSAFGKGEVVLGLAFMLLGENSQEITNKLKSKLLSIKKTLPEDIEVKIVYERTELTQKVINTVKHNLSYGAFLVVSILLLILGDIKAGILVALTIPISMLLAGAGMYYFGIAASLLSLGAIDFGIIIDASVVMTESNMRALTEKSVEKGEALSWSEKLSTLIESSREVIRPILFGVGIIIIVFLPVLSLEGTEGKMFRPMASTFILALGAGLFLSLTLTPILNYLFLSSHHKTKEGVIESILKKIFKTTLNFSIKLRWLLIVLVIGIFIVSFQESKKLGAEFLPKLSEGAIVINTIRLAGISIKESIVVNSKIEQLLLKEFPNEIKHIWSRIGTAEVATDPMGTELTDMFMTLYPRKNWKKAKTQKELSEKIQKILADFPGANFVFSQPIELRMNEMESGIRSDIGIKIYGDDFKELVRISDEVQRVLLQIKGQSDISVDQITGQPNLKIKLNPKNLGRYGISSRHILDFPEAIGGIKVGNIYQGQRNFPLVVRLPDHYRRDTKKLEETIVTVQDGSSMKLSNFLSTEMKEGISTINREWGKRLIRVQCNVKGRDVESFVKEAKKKIDEKIKLPTGYFIDWGGQFENLERAKLKFLILVPATLIIVFFLLYISLNCLSDVLIIYLGIPFAWVGGIWALSLRNIPFSVSAAIGFIALSGIAVLNGQILISAIRSFIAKEIDSQEAVISAATQRLKPVLATAITDAAGFLPMAISTGVGAEVQNPLATVVIGGVLTSTILTLFLLPILFLLINRKEKT